MEEKEVVIDNPVVIGEVTLIPIARVLVHYWHGKGGISFFAVKQPVAVIVVSPPAKRAFRVTGEEVSIDQLVAEFPTIEGALPK
jgi:uncharacterized spore protein YtfJ